MITVVKMNSSITDKKYAVKRDDDVPALWLTETEMTELLKQLRVALERKVDHIKVSLTGSYIRLDVAGDADISYPIATDRLEENVANFTRDLTRALRGERLSTLG